MPVKQSRYALKTERVYRPCRLGAQPRRADGARRVVVGQDRALEALAFGLDMASNGYNIFCVGPKGVGRTSLTLEYVRSAARAKPAPDDWCFVFNFEMPHQPYAIPFAAGQGRMFERDARRMAQTIKKGVLKAFHDDAYAVQAQRIERDYDRRKEAYFSYLEKKIATPEVGLVRLPTGVSVAPRKAGAALASEQFNALPKAERKRMLAALHAAQEALAAAVRKMPAFDALQQAELEQMNKRIVSDILDRAAAPVRKAYGAIAGVEDYLSGARAAVLNHIALLAPGEWDDAGAGRLNDLWSRLLARLFVAHAPQDGAPVVHVNHPTLSNLLGKVERTQANGSLIADFSMIRPGALHLANGGYLVIEARDFLDNAAAWNALKRCLFAHQIKMETGVEDNSIFGAVAQDPLPIPLDVKVVLIGELDWYHRLAEKDDEFAELFKVQSWFAPHMPRTPAGERAYAHILRRFAREAGLRPLSREALERTIEHAARLAGHQDRLTTYVAHVQDVLREADAVAAGRRGARIEARDIAAVFDSRRRRVGAIQDDLLSSIKAGVVSICTRGRVVGQANALVVHNYSNFSFGRPNRVTCQIRLGRGNMVDIEREVALGGPLHAKGVLILSAFLAGRYTQNAPLALDASLALEQSYNEIDGDSASLAELCCLLSAIGGIPLNQGIALTGSVNQLGEVQAVGAVADKIEGYFDVCRTQGLAGCPGVVIPAATARQLMLAARVRDAIRQGKFAVYAVRTIDEAMEVLGGLKRAEMDKKVAARLARMARDAKEFGLFK
ncbi:MAG: AAA family ATPase [Alphaproteobacteria bacterium]|nr:AAA family ATPase [Alphaproteobacteria bacterium]